jgi:hypothetical protein
MRILHISCKTGVSGDMLLAALLDLGSPLAELEDDLAGLKLDAFELGASEKIVAGIRTLHLDVRQTGDQPLRRYSDIMGIIEDSGLPGAVKSGAGATIKVLGEAEAAVHGVGLEDVHFHEIGAVDTIVDIVGAHCLVHRLSPDRVTSTPVNLGSGFVDMAHGRHPVPAPACAELSKDMAVFATDLGREAATPTGMALVKTLAAEYLEQPAGVVRAVGYGSGGYSGDDFPTYVRACIIDAP